MTSELVETELNNQIGFYTLLKVFYLAFLTLTGSKSFAFVWQRRVAQVHALHESVQTELARARVSGFVALCRPVFKQVLMQYI